MAAPCPRDLTEHLRKNGASKGKEVKRALSAKRRGSRWSFQDDRTLVELAQTKSVSALAKRFGTSPEVIERKLAKMGMPVRPDPVARAEAIRRMVELGLKVKEK